MTEFIPRNKISLRETVERAANAWYPREMQHKALTPEQADLLFEYSMALFSASGCSEHNWLQSLLETTDMTVIESLQALESQATHKSLSRNS